MKKLIVSIPKSEKSKWKIGWGCRARRMARADTLYNRAEHLLLRTNLKEKTVIVIKEHDGTRWENVNESLASRDAKYLLFVLACFMEDYLSHRVLTRKLKRYEPTGD